MRTTLSLDPDVAARITELREDGNRPLKQVINDLLRAGLDHLESKERERSTGPFTRPVDLGAPRLGDVDDVAEVLAVAEGDDFR